MKFTKLLLAFAFVLSACKTTNNEVTKPSVWIYTDMTDNTLPGKNHMGTINDPDDISAMGGYLLLANEFNTINIVVGSTHRKEHDTTPNQEEWAYKFFEPAYNKDLPGLNKNIGGYPDKLRFTQSSIKKTAERFNPEDNYNDLSNYKTVKLLLDELEKTKDVINVLCWGSLTEPAILVKHCISNNKTALLKNMRIIAHWTNSSWHQGSMEHPENVANCREDAEACAFLKEQALNRTIDYYECGAIGQHGIVSGSQKGKEYYDQFRVSALGTIFIEGKFVHNSVDHSDAATYWVLLGNWGVSLNDIAPDGTNPPEVEKANKHKFEEWSHRIHDELLRRAKAVAN